MKIYQTVILLFLIITLSSCSQDKEIKKELAEIKHLLTEINQKLERPENSNVNNESLADNCQTALPFRKEAANIKALEKISLPENPTKNQILTYIEKICILSAKQSSFSDSDPQVSMLTQIGHENLELLLNINCNHQIEFYTISAISLLAQPEDKALILQYLPLKKELVKIVTQKGWEKDAKLILYNELKQMPHYLPIEWIKAIANLQDPLIYEDLKQYLILGSNKKWTYEAIKMLPGIALENTVIQAWKNAKRDRWSRNTFAPIALAYGQSDALSAIVESLDSPANDYNAVRYPRKYILQYTYVSGSNNDIREWYDKNKSNLYFDKAKKKYIVKK